MSDGEEFMKAYAQMVKSAESLFVSVPEAFQKFSASLESFQILLPLMFNCRCSSCVPDTFNWPSDTREEVVKVAAEKEFAKERQNSLVVGRYGRCLSR